MDAINTLRAVLVGGAVVAALFAVVYGYWSAALLLIVAVGAHAALWAYLRRRSQPPAPLG